MIATCSAWLEDLGRRSPIVRSLCSPGLVGCCRLSRDGKNLANNDRHASLIVGAIERLYNQNILRSGQLQDVLKNLIERNTYGQFCELSGYDWLVRNGVRLNAQVRLVPPEVLNGNGCTVDGYLPSSNVYFDIKGFGLEELIAKELVSKLEEKLPGRRILVQGNMDVSTKDMERLFRQLDCICKTLHTSGRYEVEAMGLTIEARVPRAIESATRTWEPYAMAEAHKLSPFRHASQFTRKAPFVLIFAIHPWFNLRLHVNFQGSTEIFVRSLARRAFMEFGNDRTLANEHDRKVGDAITLSDASRLLSALFFVDVSPECSPAWLFLNPRATHRIRPDWVEGWFDFRWPKGLKMDDFEHDNY